MFPDVCSGSAASGGLCLKWMISASHGAEHGGYVPAEHQTQHPWIFTVLQRFCALHLPRSVFIEALAAFAYSGYDSGCFDRKVSWPSAFRIPVSFHRDCGGRRTRHWAIDVTLLRANQCQTSNYHYLGSQLSFHLLPIVIRLTPNCHTFPPSDGACMYKRLVQFRTEEALSDTPVVLIIGPRRAGKTTLVV